MHGPPAALVERVRDIRMGEGLLLAPLAALMIFLGVYPRPVGDLARPAVTQYVARATGTPVLPAVYS